MKWVKQHTDTYRRPAVLALDDTAEILLRRGSEYAGDQETAGFIPTEALPLLVRAWTPTKGRRAAARLVAAGLWETAPGGWTILHWEDDQSALDALSARRRADRERQQRRRVTKRLEALAPDVLALRDALDEAGISPSWAGLDADDAHEIDALLTTHGQDRLVRAARNVYQPDNPARSIRAFLPTWRDLRPPRKRTPHPDAHPYTPDAAGSCQTCGFPERNARHG